MAKKEATSNDSGTSSLPSEGVRTIISFLLIVHLSAIAIGWLSSNSLGRSQLVGSAADRFFRPYVRTLWLGNSYEYNYVNNPRTQVGAVARVAVKGAPAANSANAYPIVDRLGDTRQQYLQRLLNDAASTMTETGDETQTDRLLELVGAHILRETSAKNVELRLFLASDDYQGAKTLHKKEPGKRSVYGPPGEEISGYESPVTVELVAVSGEFPTLIKKTGKMQSSPAVPNSTLPAVPSGVPPVKTSESTNSPLKSTVPSLPATDPKPN